MIGISEFIERNISGGYWHTTSLPRYKSILADGFIKAEPVLPESERYGGNPFVRSLGGVSLFDFPIGFDLDAYEAEIPTASIGEFVPYKKVWRRSVWLRVDADLVAANLLSGAEVRARWKQLGSSKRFMAQIEGAHFGDIPIAAISRAYHIGEGDEDWHQLQT